MNAPRLPGGGIFAALAAWAKLAALVVVPLWATYPNAREWRRTAYFSAAFTVTTALSFWILVVGGEPVEELRRFSERTFEIQFDRRSPFSLWDWGQYHAQALPDLRWLQRLLQVALVAAALALAFVPRRKSPLQLAALTAALLMGFQPRSPTGRRSTSHGSSRSSPWRSLWGPSSAASVSERAPLRLPLRSERPPPRESPAV